jgi:hypothetical protein
MAGMEQLGAWTRLKKHLTQTQLLMLSVKEEMKDLEVRVEVEKICEQIDQDINTVEEMFIMAED